MITKEYFGSLFVSLRKATTDLLKSLAQDKALPVFEIHQIKAGLSRPIRKHKTGRRRTSKPRKISSSKKHVK